ncbi:hypothetical protein VTH82DRAFT_6866 [Thermothelomyces myriococcoides]
MTPALRRLLEDAFKRFSNLKAVGFSHHNAAFQDVMGMERNLACQGWSYIHRITGCDPAVPWYVARRLGPDKPPVRARVFAAILMAQAAATKSEIDTLDTCGRCCYGLIMGDYGLTDEEWDSILHSFKRLKSSTSASET